VSGLLDECEVHELPDLHCVQDCWKDPEVTLQVFTADVFPEEKKQDQESVQGA
jgi:AMMECR1 domain-containing protein